MKIYTLTPADYNSNDCTASIQAALKDHEQVIIPFLGDGTWRTRQLTPKCNQKIIINADVRLQGKEKGFPNYDDAIIKIE